MAQGEEALDVLHRFARMLETDRELEQRLDAALGTELWSATEEGAELRTGPGGGQRA